MPLLHRHREKVVCCVTFERLEKWHLCETMAGIAYGGLQLLSCVVCTSCCVGEEKRQVRPVSIPFSPFSVQSRPILEVPTRQSSWHRHGAGCLGLLGLMERHLGPRYEGLCGVERPKGCKKKPRRKCPVDTYQYFILFQLKDATRGSWPY